MYVHYDTYHLEVKEHIQKQTKVKLESLRVQKRQYLIIRYYDGNDKVNKCFQKTEIHHHHDHHQSVSHLFIIDTKQLHHKNLGQQ